MTLKLVIVQPYVPRYREPFFDGLRLFLERFNISLTVAVGQPSEIMKERGDAINREWIRTYNEHNLAIGKRFIRVGTARSIWRNAAAVIVPDYGSSWDSNLACLRFFGPEYIGVWGHIKSYRGRENVVDRAIERWQLRRASHVFAYMPAGEEEAKRIGVDPMKITCVMNTLDVASLEKCASHAEAVDLDIRYDGFPLNRKKSFGYIGGLDAVKRIDFLSKVLDRLWEVDPEIKLYVCGKGRDSNLLDVSVARGQTTLLGYADEALKARLARSIRALLMPGAIGLVAVDALALKLPILATTLEPHGPEAEYLEEGVSLFTAGDTVESYVTLLLNASTSGISADFPPPPSMDSMVRNFGEGVKTMLRPLIK